MLIRSIIAKDIIFSRKQIDEIFTRGCLWTIWQIKKLNQKTAARTGSNFGPLLTQNRGGVTSEIRPVDKLLTWRKSGIIEGG